THDGHFADATKLVDRCQATNHCVILHHNMSSQSSDIGHDDVVTKSHVMRDVGVSEDVIVRTDCRTLAISGGAVDRDVLAESVAIADPRPRNPPLPLQILRFEANAGEWKDLIVATEGDVAINNDVRVKLASFTEDHMFTNHTIGTNITIGTDSRFG